MGRKVIIFVIFLVLLGVGGYVYVTHIQATPIHNIKSHPRNYVDKKVHVKGRVLRTFSFISLNYFEISDGTDSIMVITRKPLPVEGEELTITGTVKYITIGLSKIIAIEEE